MVKSIGEVLLLNVADQKTVQTGISVVEGKSDKTDRFSRFST